MTLDQVYDELYGEIDQIKNELKNTLAQIQYASNFTEGVPLGTLSVGSESSQVIAPHVALLPGAESGMMVLDLPVGTESAMLPVMIQDDPEATELAGDAIPTGETLEGYLNSNNHITTGLTTPSDVTIDAGGYWKIGNIVFFNIRLIFSSDIAYNTSVVSGLPTSIVSDNNVAPVLCNVSQNYSLYVTYGGEVKNSVNMPAGTYLISGFYLTNG